MSMYVCFNCL